MNCILYNIDKYMIFTKTLCVSSCVSPLTELFPLLVPIPRSLKSLASSSWYMAKLMLSFRPLLPLSSIISEKVLLRRRCRSCSSSSSFLTSTTRSMMCSWRFLRLLFQLSRFWTHHRSNDLILKDIWKYPIYLHS